MNNEESNVGASIARPIRETQRGITLIALIITIIVLLILAGVVLSLTIGERGIFNTAKQSKKEYIISEMKEELELALNDLRLEKLGNASLDDVTQAWADSNKLKEYNTIITSLNSTNEKIATMTKNGITKIYKIKIDLTLEEIDDIIFGYEIVQKEGNKAKISIKILSGEGIKQIITPNSELDPINCNGKLEAKLEYEVEYGTEYIFTIITTSGKEKQEKVLLLPEIKISTPTVNKSNSTTVETSEEEHSIDEETPLYINFNILSDGVTSLTIKNQYEETVTMPYKIRINGKYIFTVEGKYGEHTITKTVEVIVNQFEVGNLIPFFTDSNTKDGVTVSVSDCFYEYHPYEAVDRDLITGWVTDSGNYDPHWFLVEFPEPKVVKRYKLIGMRCWGLPYTFCLQASNDNQNWIDLEDEIHEPGGSYSAITFQYNIDNENAYKYYRIYIPAGGWNYGSSGGCAIYELKLYSE